MLEAAERVFVEGGAEAARMEVIAERAGVAVGTLYNHFESRDDLLGAIVESHRAALLERLDRALGQSRARPFDEALGAFLHAFFEHLSEHRPLLARLVQEEGSGIGSRGKGPLLDEVTGRVESLLRRGRAQGALRTDPSGLQSFLLVGMLRGVLRWDAARSRSADPGALAARVQGAFLDGQGVRR
ncbi:MAG TPA: TetR/AcrR family transcriptional regulator [Anaeromyxobacteraceae bacterium]|nr:TetR/AcrR family transcriptional regulator [Anaeromyxobacteraceae bacterium]